MLRRLTFPTLLAATQILVATACGDDPTPPPTAPPRRPTMVVISGSDQTADVGTTLPAPLVVRVLDSLDAPAQGIVVRFSSLNSFARDTTTTDAQGIASLRWTLDTLASAHEIVAQATLDPSTPHGTLSATFRATATPLAPARVVVTGGDGAVAAPTGRVDTVVVAAFDRYGNASPIAQVDWVVRAGGGTVRAIHTRTDDRGEAQAIWHVGPTEGPNALDVVVGSIQSEVLATASIEFPGSLVVVGASHSCALTTAGAAYCWGANSSGQLGIQRVDDTIYRVPQRVGGGRKFTSLTAGANHTCGVTADGGAYCWGNGRFGQLGIGSVGLVAMPAAVAGGLAFRALAAGAHHTCGLTTVGAIYCWGENSVGQLGDAVDRPLGPQGARNHPVLISAAGSPTFTALAAGTWSTCAISTNGGTYCWGANAQRELGGDISGRCSVIGTQMFYDGTTPVPCSAAPIRLDVFELRALAVRESGWCGVTTAAAIICWGNAFERPRIVSDASVTTAWVVGIDVCGRHGFDAVTCWGVWGGRTGFPIVRPFGDQVPLAMLASGQLHTCGVSTSGRTIVHCWGDNGSGQLGDGTTVSKPLPVPVLSPLIH
jgi:hypothetical protein